MMITPQLLLQLNKSQFQALHNEQFDTQQHGYIRITNVEDPTKEIIANFTMVSCCDEPDNQSIYAATRCQSYPSLYAATTC